MSCLSLPCLDAFPQPSHLPLFHHPNNIWRRGRDDIEAPLYAFLTILQLLPLRLIRNPQ